MGLLSSYRTYRQRKHLKDEAKQLLGEARRLMNKKSLRIPQKVVALVNESVAQVEGARQDGSIDVLKTAVSGLNTALNEHLSHARKSSIRQYAESIGVALGVALLLRAFVVEAFQIPSGSMIPTLEVGDHIFVSKFAYSIRVPFTNVSLAKLGQPKRGDVIVFRYPPDQSVDYIKRVVGLPGETIEVRRNEILINGKPMARRELPGACITEENPLFEEEAGMVACERWVEYLDGREHALHQDPHQSPSEMPPTAIPEGHYFVMGDNRDNSKDSRVWGFVPMELIKGRALVIWWSRDPARGGLSPSGIAEWFGSIRGRRFFKSVD